jgi:hypothetical protein
MDSTAPPFGLVDIFFAFKDRLILTFSKIYVIFKSRRLVRTPSSFGLVDIFFESVYFDIC